MTTSDQTNRAKQFTALHVPGAPVVLHNIWDAGSARAVAKAGASAIATGSWSVAAAQGFADGQKLPLDTALATAQQIVAAVDLPVTVDFERGYGETPEAVAANVTRLAATGAVGMNFEDQKIGASGLYDIQAQANAIAAAREAAGPGFFINARTDVFLQAPPEQHAGLVADALSRAKAYAAAGANGLFVPGLVDPALMAQICGGTDLPVNVMVLDLSAPLGPFAKAGVARISRGPAPYMRMIKDLTAQIAG